MLACDSASSGVIGMIPALLTRMSIGPRRRSTSSRKAVKPARSVTSSPSPTTASPSSAAVRSAASRSTSPIATRAPLAISASVIARPMPRAPPVTTAVLPLSERGCLAMLFRSSSGDDVSTLQVRAAGKVGRERADVSGGEHAAAVREQVQPRLDADLDRPLLACGHELHVRLLAELGDPGERRPQQVARGGVVAGGEHPV